MRERFMEELSRLNVAMIRLGALSEDAIKKANACLQQKSPEQIQETNDIAGQIRDLEREVEQLCMKILLREQPVAGDLRNVSSAMRMIYDMQRIGDQAADIAEISDYIGGNQLLNDLNVGELAEYTKQMVSQSIDSYVEKDLDKAIAAIKEDDKVDESFARIRANLTKTIGDQPQDADSCLDILMASKYFERIGDHAENIARHVYFSLTGSHYEG